MAACPFPHDSFLNVWGYDALLQIYHGRTAQYSSGCYVCHTFDGSISQPGAYTNLYLRNT